MERIWSTDLTHLAGERVTIAGWLHPHRRLSNVGFVILRDARGLIQIVIEDPALTAQLAGVHHESVLRVNGLVVENPQAPGGVELHDPAIEIVSAATAPPPFDLFRPTLNAQLPALLDQAALSLRHPKRRAVFALASTLMASFRETLRGQGLVEIQTPKLVEAATESGANVFPVDYMAGQPTWPKAPNFTSR